MSFKRILHLFFRTTIKVLLILVILVGIVVSCFYSATNFYIFPNKKQFSGSSFYNPYQELNGNEIRTKANFHAHSKAWGDLTYGSNTTEDVYNAYIKKGYQVAGVSNYHQLSFYAKDTARIHVPVYEHGYNVFKSHYLAVNPECVSQFDYPLMQSTSMQQNIIENIRKTKGLVVMAHPKFGGRTFEGMELLCNYDFMEVLNHYRVSDEYWDRALSAGKLSWIMANDDTHDVRDETAFKIWNEIFVDTLSKENLLLKLKQGMHYGIKSLNQISDTKLEWCKIENDSLHVRFEQEINRFEVSCQNGKMVTMLNASNELHIPLLDTFQYIRVVAHNDESSAYLNPIVRCNENELPHLKRVTLEIDTFKTWLFRIGMYLLILGQLYLSYKIVRKKKAIQLVKLN